MLHYPQEFPGDAARLIVKNWRAGTIASTRAETAEAAWNIVGYGLKASLGSPGEGGTSPGALKMQQSPISLDETHIGNADVDEEMIAKLETYDNHPPDVKLMQGLPLDMKAMIQWAMSVAIRIINGTLG